MDFDNLWGFFSENLSFFENMAHQAGVRIAPSEKRFYHSDGRWSPDPMYLLLVLFRKKFEMSSPSSDNEFVRMSKILYSSGIKIPIKKKEYDEYIKFDMINQSVLSAIETVLSPKNGVFTIPSKEFATSMFKNASRNMEDILDGLFIYEGSSARYYVDIYDRLTGFEIILDTTTIFIPVRFTDVNRSAFLEDRLLSLSSKDTVSIRDIRESSEDYSTATVFLPEESTDGIANVVSYFDSLNIDSDSDDFVVNSLNSILKFGGADKTILIKNDIATLKIAEMMASLYETHGSSSIARIIDIARIVSKMNTISRGMVLDAVSKIIPQDIVDLIKPYIDGSDNNYVMKISELINNKHIELTSRIVRLNGDSSLIRFYNKDMKYFKDFSLDKNGIMNELVPEIGGVKYIASYCGVNGENIPSGFSTIESFIVSTVMKVIHSEFAALPVFDRFYGAGVHKIGDKIVYNSKHGVYGLGGRHSFGGVLFSASDTDVMIPKTRPTKNTASAAISRIVESVNGFIPSADGMSELFAILVASSAVLPVLNRANKPILSVYGAGVYTKNGMIRRVFEGRFRNSKCLNTDSEFVVKKSADGSTAVLVSELTPKTEKILRKLSLERYGTETISRFKNTDSTIKSINTSPIVVFSQSPWLIDESMVFNFPARVSSEASAYLVDADDVSHILISFVMNSLKKILSAESKFVSAVLKKLNKKRLDSRHPYVDFFEKILPGMCLVDTTGYMDGWDFHDMMYEVFFSDEAAASLMNIEKLLLNMKSGDSKIEDKLFDKKLRMNQHGDLIAVDKIYHKSYIDKGDTDNFVLLFRKKDVYESLNEDIGMNFIQFSRMLDEYGAAINIDNAMRNYRVEHDKNKTIYNWYNELFGRDKDNFCAIKISKKRLYGL